MRWSSSRPGGAGRGDPPRGGRDQRVRRAARLHRRRDRDRLPRATDGRGPGVAEREEIDIRLYNIIYEAVAEVAGRDGRAAQPRGARGSARHGRGRQIFKVPRVGTVAGCMVTDGEIQRRGQVRVVRDGVQVYEGELGSLKRFKDDVREVREGFECGLNISTSTM
jgi:translation initiation factor IF-2